MPKMVSEQQKQAKRKAARTMLKMQALRAKYDAANLSEEKKAERLSILKERFPQFEKAATLDEALALLEQAAAAEVFNSRN